MTVFVDTSAFYAVFDRSDSNHGRAREIWAQLLDDATNLVTNNYVLVETIALLQHRLGLAATRAFHEDVVPVLSIDWVSEQRHKAGMEAALAAARKKLSLVDCVSFQTMRELGLRTAFCFDNHFREQGFDALS
jgi:predicted nucleic acid-binding protein